MLIKYNQSGDSRRAFVQAVSSILEKPALYLGAPAFSYRVDKYTIDRNGALCCPDDTDRDDVRKLVFSLQERGYMPENYEELFPENKDRLIIEIPRTGITEQTLENIRKITASKASLLKLALGTDTLDITVDAEKIRFPWFALHGIEGEADAYSRLASAICDMAKRQKRVTATEKPVENAKFSMRLFLIRLGFIGDEYKNARKILLRNLEGNSSWKYGRPPERAARPQMPAVPPGPMRAAAVTDFDRPLTAKTVLDDEPYPEKGKMPYGVYERISRQ